MLAASQVGNSEASLPSKAYTAAMAIGVTQDLTGQHVVVHENILEALLEISKCNP